MNKKVSVESWIVYLLLALMWGSSFILMHRGLHSFSFDQVAAFRVMIAGIVLCPIALWRLKGFKKNKILPALIYASLGSAIPAFLFPLGQTHLPSGVAGILNSLTPIFVLLTGILFFRATYTKQKALGIFIGFAGILCLKLLGENKTDNSIDYNYAWFLVLATFFYGLSNQILSRYLHSENPITITATAFLMLLPFASVYLFSTPVFEVFKTKPDAWIDFASIATLSIFGTAIALPLYNWLAQKTGVLFASTLTFVMPIVSLAWGMIDGEALGIQHIASMLIILTGVYLVRKK